MTYLQDLLEQRNRVWATTKTHLDTVEKEGRSLTGEAKVTYERLSDDLRKFDERIAETRQLIESDRASDEARGRSHDLAGRSSVTSIGARPTADAREFLTGETRSIGVPIQRRDLTVGTATAGGDTVPTMFSDRLIEHLIEASPILGLAEPINSDSGASLEVPTTTGYGTAVATAEGISLSESDPAFSKVTLNAYKYGKLTQLTNELLEDSGVDLNGFVSRESAHAIASVVDPLWITGTGTGQPTGVVTGSSLGVTAASGTVIAPDELVDMFFAVTAPYRASRRCAWLMNDGTLAHISKLKDANNQYLLRPSGGAEAPNSLLGKPVFTDPNMPNIGLSAKSILFGDFSRFAIRTVGGIRLDRSADYAFDQDMVTWRVVIRTDSNYLDSTGAIKHLIQAAA